MIKKLIFKKGIMKGLITKILFITTLISASFLIAFPWNEFGFNDPVWEGKYKLGLDLSGGIELDYKVDLEEARKDETFDKAAESNTIEALKRIVDKRISNLNINDSVITTSSYGDERHIIVQIPLKSEDNEKNTENIEKAKEAIWKVVKIEFREKKKNITEEDYKARTNIANSLLEEAKSSEYNFSVTAQKYQTSFQDVAYSEKEASVDEFKKYYELEEVKTGLVNKVYKKGNHELKLEDIKDGVSIPTFGGKGYNIVNVIEVKEDKVKFDEVIVSDDPTLWIAAVDSKGRILNDKYFQKADVSFNQAQMPQISLLFNEEGGEIFYNLTKRLVGQQIAIFVGWELVTAPNVNEPIAGWSAVINGNYTIEEARQTASDINSWVIPSPIYLTSERSIDSKLGANSLNKLIVAGLTGLAIIIFFLIVVYRTAGFVAGLALVSYVLIVLSLVKATGTVLTLASIAGLVLSIWMAIDANILIFERIKDELRSGKNPHKSSEIGFEKSWTAIWDSNITGLIIAFILYVFGVNMIKWFGIMLGLGTVVSLFTAMYVSKAFVVVIAKKKNLNTKTFIWYKK